MADSTPEGSTDGTVVNNASLVLLVEATGARLLLTGDIEPEAQRVLTGSGVDLDVDVLKVAHHGSADQDPGFLAAAAPEVAVVSVGADNDYGHPAVPVLSTLAAEGAQVARTDTDGDVAVVVSGGMLRLATRGP
jgi:competence protein ComEC